MIVVLAQKQKTELQDEIELLSKIKADLKENDVAKEICKEYGFDIDIIDGVPLKFSDELDVSARTKDSHIELNSNLMDEPFETMMRYAIHELVHALQHMKSKHKVDPHKDMEYLDRPDELEAFQYQIKFEDDARGPMEAENYVDNLLDYHDIDVREREDKREELLDKV